MFEFSSRTAVNKKFKVSEFLKTMDASKEARLESKRIKEIIFSNVINSKTLNCEEDDKYKNIYIIRIVLNEPEVPKNFLEELDKHIRFHTYFVFEYEGQVSTWITYKEIGIKVKLDKYYYHEFHNKVSIEAPMFDNVVSCYKTLLSYEVGIKYLYIESVETFIERIAYIKKLEKLIEKTKSKIISEIQPKKKLELNAKLRDYIESYNKFSNLED